MLGYWSVLVHLCLLFFVRPINAGIAVATAVIDAGIVPSSCTYTAGELIDVAISGIMIFDLKIAVIVFCGRRGVAEKNG